MNSVVRIVVAIPAILFLISGLRWIVDPAGSAAALGMPLLDGVGRSTQIGDMAGYFLTLGILILVGVITSKRSWYYPAVLLLGLSAVSRVLAWLIHDAALAVQFIATEVVIVCLLLFAASRLPEKE